MEMPPTRTLIPNNHSRYVPFLRHLIETVMRDYAMRNVFLFPRHEYGSDSSIYDAKLAAGVEIFQEITVIAVDRLVGYQTWKHLINRFEFVVRPFRKKANTWFRRYFDRCDDHGRIVLGSFAFPFPLWMPKCQHHECAAFPSMLANCVAERYLEKARLERDPKLKFRRKSHLRFRSTAMGEYYVGGVPEVGRLTDVRRRIIGGAPCPV